MINLNRTVEASRLFRRPVVRRLLLAVIFLGLGTIVIAQFLSIARQVKVDEYQQRIAERLTLYESTIRSALQQHRSMPYLIARSDIARLALTMPEYYAGQANRFLEDAAEDAGADVIYLMATDGLTVASSNWQEPQSFVGGNFSYRPYFQDAMKGEEGGFFAVGTTSFKPGYYMSRPVKVGNKIIGVAVVKVDISEVQSRWDEGGEHVFVADALGVVFLASDNNWRYTTLEPADEEMLARIREVRQYDGKELPPLGLTIRHQHGHDIMRLSGQQFLFGKARLEDLDWVVYYLMPYSSIESQLEWLLVILVVLLLALFLFYLLLRERRERLHSRREVEEAARIRAANKLLEDEIEERRRTERELRETESELVQATKLAALGQMSASVAHEINQPLAAIQVNVASARLLLQQQRSREIEDVLGHVEALVARMSIIVRELKSFARRSDGRIEPFDLRKCLDNALVLLDVTIRHAQVTVQQIVPAGQVEVLGDQLRIEQVLINLFRNAIDAMDEADQRVMSIHITVNPSTVCLQVEDTGEGVPASPHQVFEPFFTTKSSGEGLGLGLSIAERIVQGVGGSLVAENRPQGGARFILTLQRPHNE